MAEAHAAVGHQFETLEQEHEANQLGMWAFLASEVLFFGALFTSFLVYRLAYPEPFVAASQHLKQALATANTAVLLTSSLTMALAVHSAQTGHRRRLVTFLLMTMLLGAVFLGVKGVEYLGEFREGLVPFRAFPFAFEGPSPERARLFFTFYFFMTGLHALHLTIGMAAVGLMALLAWRGGVTPRTYMPVELTGLYWHFVDVVWVFLFPLLYLIG